MAKISLRVKVPRIVSVEVDHRPSGSRKIPPLRVEELCIARTAYVGVERTQPAAAQRDRDVRGRIIAWCGSMTDMIQVGNSWDRMWGEGVRAGLTVL